MENLNLVNTAAVLGPEPGKIASPKTLFMPKSLQYYKELPSSTSSQENNGFYQLKLRMSSFPFDKKT